VIWRVSAIRIGWSVSTVVTGRVIGHAVARSPEDRFVLGADVFDQVAECCAGQPSSGPGDLGYGGHQRQPGVLAFGEVDRVRQCLVGVR
jgi:hypothetical protein